MEERIYQNIPGAETDEAPENFKPLRPAASLRDLATPAPPIALGSGGYGGQQRQSARGMIQSRIRNLRREADGLESLLRSIPEQLPPEADAALWSAMCKP